MKVQGVCKVCLVKVEQEGGPDYRSERCAIRVVGGESRKSRKPFAATKSKVHSNFRRDSANTRRRPSWWELQSVSKNTNWKGLILCILRNVPNNVTSWGK